MNLLSSAIELLKRGVKRSFWLTTAAYVATDSLSGLRFRLGDISTDSGTEHHGSDLKSSLAYIHEVYGDYKLYGELDSFHGKVVEVGPGDNTGVALLILGDGAAQVDLADRFYSIRDTAYQREIAEAILSNHPILAMTAGDASPHGFAVAGVNHYHGPDAAAEMFFLHHRDYDFILSRAVFEHVYDPAVALRLMVSALNPGGKLLHKVDLRDHGLFSQQFHELKFFETPDWIHKRMTRGAGRPNRFLINTYRQVIEDTAMEARFLITRLAGVGDIKPHLEYHQIDAQLRERSASFVRQHRDRYAKSLRKLSDEDLSVAGFFLVARKPR